MLPPEPLFLDYASFLARHFAGKVQKLPVDAGFGCPNRDGTIGRDGCAFCSNVAFTPRYCAPSDSVQQQLARGKDFFAGKYPNMSFLAYFQAHTNTHAPLDVLRRRFEEALSVDGIKGLVLGTRPDCLPGSVLDLLAELAQRVFVMVELGVESTDDRLLRVARRGHTFADAARAICALHDRGLYVGAHVILGLPGQTRAQRQSEPALLSALPIDVLKLHHLQIVRGTAFARLYAENPAAFPELYATPEAYVADVADYIARLRPDMALDRFVSQSPSSLLVAPRWGIKPHEFLSLLRQYMHSHDLRQGLYYGG